MDFCFRQFYGQFLAAVFVASQALSASAAPLHTIRLQSYETEIQAQAAQVDLLDNFSPLWVHEEQTSGTVTFALMAGEFPSYPDAWAYAGILAEGTARGAKAVTIEDAVKSHRRTKSVQMTKAGIEENILPVVMPFLSEDEVAAEAQKNFASGKSMGEEKSAPTITEKPPAELLAKTVDLLTKQELLVVGMNAPKNTQGVPALERFLVENPTDEQANATRLRLARRLLGRKDFARVRELLATVKSGGTNQEKAAATLFSAYADVPEPGKDAYNGFKAIANDASASPAMRREARLRVANIYHGRKKPATSWLAFRQIERDQNSAQQTEAKVQLAGLAFEIVKDHGGEGTWSEVRSFCDTVTDSANAPPDTKATAALMKLETHFEEGDMDACLAGVEDFLALYPETPKREVAMARLWRGIALTKKGDFAAAKAALNGVTELPLTAADKFRGKEPHAIAYAWLGWIAKRENNAVELQRVLAALDQEFPSNSATKRVQAYARSTGAATAPEAPAPGTPEAQP